MTRMLGLTIRAGVLMVRAAIWAAGPWSRLCVGVPMRILWWIWRRPLPLWRRLSFVIGPWLLLGIAAVPSVIVQEGGATAVASASRQVPYAMIARAARAERQALESVLAGVDSFASPWEPLPESPPVRAPRTKRAQSPKPRCAHHWRSLVARSRSCSASSSGSTSRCP